MKSTFPCPKCQSPNPKGALDCSVCGIVFAKYLTKQSETQQIQDYQKDVMETSSPVNTTQTEIAAPIKKINTGSIQINQLWEKVMADYDNLDVHDEFINKAMKSNNLAFASQQYRNILNTNPHEEIAQKMQKRITGLAINIFTPEHEAVEDKFHFGISGTLASIGVMMMGIAFFLPDLLTKMSLKPNIFEFIGSAMVVIAISGRFFMQRKKSR